MRVRTASPALLSATSSAEITQAVMSRDAATGVAMMFSAPEIPDRSPTGSNAAPMPDLTAARSLAKSWISATTVSLSPATSNARSMAWRILFACPGRMRGIRATSASDNSATSRLDSSVCRRKVRCRNNSIRVNPGNGFCSNTTARSSVCCLILTLSEALSSLKKLRLTFGNASRQAFMNGPERKYARLDAIPTLTDPAASIPLVFTSSGIRPKWRRSAVASL